jgi:hypothetical protein
MSDEIAGIEVRTDPDMPPGEFELRSGDAVVRGRTPDRTMSDDATVEMSREYAHALHGEVASLRARLFSTGVERDQALAEQRRLSLWADNLEAALARIEALCQAQGEDSYVMVYALRKALDGGAP